MARFDRDKYVSVQERINRFRTEFPDGFIVTDLMSLPDDYTQCRYKASVWRTADEPRPAAVGWATETAGASDKDGANFGNHEENCETSAIGRALANFGYATSRDDRASQEEIDKVNRQQAPPERTSNPGQRRRIEAIAKRREISHDDWKAIAYGWFGVESTNDLSAAQAGQLGDWLDTCADPVLRKALIKAGRREGPAPDPAAQTAMPDTEPLPDYSHYTT